jgi:ADP-ribose pyrophosphatase
MEKPSVPHTIRRVFDGRIFRVVVESITTPKGSPLDAELVRHPGSVVLVPVTGTGEMVLVRQYRHAIGRWAWELPAGTLKPGEEPAAAAARECQEEIGLIPGELTRLGSFFPTPGYCDEEMNFYKATSLRAPGPEDPRAEPDADEDIERGVFTVEEVRAMIVAGDIIDLKTVAGLALLWESGGRGVRTG